MRTLLQISSLMTLFLLALTGLAAAQGTPDWITPSRETVCDNESGAAFGLCNAYCEAMDCHLDDPQASSTACSKVRDKFITITGRDLPCEGTPCPCTDNIPEFAAFIDGIATIDSCDDFSGLTQLGGDLDPFIFSFVAAGTLGGPFCGFIGATVEGGDFEQILSVTEAEAAACQEALQAAASSQGVTCG